MLIRLANQSVLKQNPKPKKKRPELTLVTVTTRNDVDIEPGYHRGADHYLVTNTFGTHRLYSLTVNRKGLTGPLIVDDVMKRLRATAGWTKVVAHGPMIYPAEGSPDTIALMLGGWELGQVHVSNDDATYTLKLDKDLDGASRASLSDIINEFLSQEVAVAADDSNYVASNEVSEMVAELDVVDGLKAFMLEHEKKVGYKLNWDEWKDLLGDAYDEITDDEEE